MSLPINQQIYIYYSYISSQVSGLLKKWNRVIVQVKPETTAVSRGYLEEASVPKFPNMDFLCTNHSADILLQFCCCALFRHWCFHFQKKHISLTPLTGYVFQSSSPSTVVVSSRTTERGAEGLRERESCGKEQRNRESVKEGQREHQE